ncbi:MAG: hypothetical protein R3B49_08165 [Phycisphaerales bacterium]
MSASRVILIVVAVGAEGAAVRRAFGGSGDPETWRPERLDDRFELVVGGVGKANAAGCVARFYDPARHEGAMSVGVCGSLPGGPRRAHGVLATASVNADEGIVTPDGFETCRQMGFPLGPTDETGSPPDPGWARALSPVVDAAGPIATVSVCSGTDAAAAGCGHARGRSPRRWRGPRSRRCSPGSTRGEVLRAPRREQQHRGPRAAGVGPAARVRASVRGSRTGARRLG